MAEDDDPAAGRQVLRIEAAARGRPYTEQLAVAGGDHLAGDVLGAPYGLEMEGAGPGVGHELLQGPAEPAPVGEVEVGDGRFPRLAVSGEEAGDDDELAGVGVRQFREQDGVDHGEDRAEGREAQRQDQHRRGREAAVQRQLAETVAKISYPGHLSSFACRLLGASAQPLSAVSGRARAPGASRRRMRAATSVAW